MERFCCRGNKGRVGVGGQGPGNIGSRLNLGELTVSLAWRRGTRVASGEVLGVGVGSNKNTAGGARKTRVPVCSKCA